MDIELDQPRVAFAVQEDVEAEELEAAAERGEVSRRGEARREVRCARRGVRRDAIFGAPGVA